MEKLIEYEVDIKPCQLKSDAKELTKSTRYPKLLRCKCNKMPKPMKKVIKKVFE